MAHLTGPACFSLIMPDMLGDVYERAVVANDRVGRSVDIKGIHYTPLTICQQILRRIPSKRFLRMLYSRSGVRVGIVPYGRDGSTTRRL